MFGFVYAMRLQHAVATCCCKAIVCKLSLCDGCFFCVLKGFTLGVLKGLCVFPLSGFVCLFKGFVGSVLGALLLLFRFFCYRSLKVLLG